MIRLASIGMVVLCMGLARPAAGLEAPRVEQMPEVRALAQELEDLAHELHELADLQAPGRQPGELLAVRELGRLAGEASRFRDAVERNGRRPTRTEDEFRALRSAYRRAANIVPWLEMYTNVWVDLEPASNLVASLEAHYED